MGCGLSKKAKVRRAEEGEFGVTHEAECQTSTKVQVTDTAAGGISATRKEETQCQSSAEFQMDDASETKESVKVQSDSRSPEGVTQDEECGGLGTHNEDCQSLAQFQMEDVEAVMENVGVQSNTRSHEAIIQSVMRGSSGTHNEKAQCQSSAKYQMDDASETTKSVKVQSHSRSFGTQNEDCQSLAQFHMEDVQAEMESVGVQSNSRSQEEVVQNVMGGNSGTHKEEFHSSTEFQIGDASEIKEGVRAQSNSRSPEGVIQDLECVSFSTYNEDSQSSAQFQMVDTEAEMEIVTFRSNSRRQEEVSQNVMGGSSGTHKQETQFHRTTEFQIEDASETKESDKVQSNIKCQEEVIENEVGGSSGTLKEDCQSSANFQMDVAEVEKDNANVQSNIKSKEEVIQNEVTDVPIPHEVQDEFPDPAKVQIVDYIPKNMGKYITVEDTFWSKKKHLIPDYSVMKKIDDHAQKAPESISTSPEKLVSYLLAPCQTEVEKVRALICWIGNNIAYDVAGKDDPSKADCTIEGVLKNKRAICEGYANVVEMFCQFADIESEKISGQTKNGSDPKPNLRIHPESSHAWNRVKLNGDWYFVDSTWCAGSVGDKVFKKQWNEWWFLPDPEAFVYSHLPMATDNSLLTEQQMVREPRLSSEEWDTKLERQPAAYAFGIEPETHKDTRINTTQNEIIIKYKYKESLSHSVHVVFQNADTSLDRDDYGSIRYEVDGMMHVHIRFDKPGVYIVNFVALVKHGDEIIKHPISCLIYRITFEGKASSPYPPDLQNNYCGLQADFHDSGFQLLHPKAPIVSTHSGFTTITTQLPTAGWVSNVVHFYEYSENMQRAMEELPGLVYSEKVGDIARFHIQCPKIGEYKLTISARHDQDNTYYPAMEFFICCTGVNTPIYHHPIERNLTNMLAGPNSHFYKTGLTTNQNSSTVHFEDNKAVFIIKKTRPASIVVQVQSACEANSAELLVVKQSKEQLEVTIKRPDVAGYYWVAMFANEMADGGSLPYAGCFCIPYQVHFHQK